VSDDIGKASDAKVSSKQRDEYFAVSFRIMGDGVEPSELTALLGVMPTKAHKKGDANTSKTKKGKIITYAPFTSGLWCLDSQLDKTSSLNDHIINIIDDIEPKKDVLLMLKEKGFEIDFYCGYFFSSSAQAGISLSNDILERMSKLGIDFNLSLYPHIC